MPNFAVVLGHAGAWDHSRGIREQKGWDEHAEFMDALVADGFVVLGGPVGDRSTTLHLVTAIDEGEIRRRFAQDPWAREGLLKVESIQRWSLWLDGRSPSRPE